MSKEGRKYMIAAEILKLIETVSPDETLKLYEIDEMVWHYVNMPYAPYTTSRDALKAIRPERFRPIEYYYGHYRAPVQAFYWCANGKKVEGLGATEELAELHAIIQAIEYERNHAT